MPHHLYFKNINMNATQEWLRYVESKAIMNRYHITGYTTDEKDEHTEGVPTEGVQDEQSSEVL